MVGFEKTKSLPSDKSLMDPYPAPVVVAVGVGAHGTPNPVVDHKYVPDHHVDGKVSTTPAATLSTVAVARVASSERSRLALKHHKVKKNRS